MNHHPPTIALLHWGDRIEDFLDSIGVSFESFCSEMTGGWLFGYIDALRLAGVRTVVYCISSRVTHPERYLHQPTGATLCVLPSPAVYQWLRRPMKTPYGWTVDEVYGGESHGLQRRRRAVAKDIAPYCATPAFSLARALRQDGCAAILCQEYEYARFDVCVAIGALLRIPVFATFQGGDFQLSRLEGPIRPLTMRRAAGFIVATKSEVVRIQRKYGVPTAKVAQVFNPMDVTGWTAMDRHAARLALGIPQEAKVVVCHGRIEVFRKGLDVLLQAWSRVCGDRPDQDLRLLLIGAGSDSQKLQQMIDEMGLRGVMRVNEYVRDRTLIRQYLSAADLYTLASRHEGFPVAPIEAMACGLPVVVTDAQGIPDILEGGEASGGVIVPREDASALAAAIGRVLDDEVLRQQLGKRARDRAEQQFSLEAIGLQLKAVLLGPSALQE